MIVNDLLSFIHEVQDIELSAIVSLPEEYNKVVTFASNNGIKKSYRKFEEMLEDNDIDTIYLGIPNHLHYSFAKQALEKNKNVICEKPITSNYKEIAKLSKIAQKKI